MSQPIKEKCFGFTLIKQVPTMYRKSYRLSFQLYLLIYGNPKIYSLL